MVVVVGGKGENVEWERSERKGTERAGVRGKSDFPSVIPFCST